MYNKKKITDLTRVLDETLTIYQDNSYSDPQLIIKPWCSIQEQGFSVSQISLGTQTGTHIDAPAHFIEGGMTLEEIPLEGLFGRYYWINLDQLGDDQAFDCQLAAYKDESILFLASRQDVVVIDEKHLTSLFSTSARLWVLSGTVNIFNRDPLFFHRALAGQGIFLVEDLEPAAAQQVHPGGELIALPLRITGVGGSPCRVIVLQ